MGFEKIDAVLWFDVVFYIVEFRVGVSGNC